MNVFDKDFIREMIDEIKDEVVDSIEFDIPQTKRVFTGVQACEYLSITPPTLSKLVRNGYVKKRYIGGLDRPCYLKEELDEYIDECKEGAY